MPFNWGGGAGGALSGAASGAAIGSIVPGIGTGIGAGLGALFGGAGGLFSGSKDKVRKIGTLTPEQQGYLKNLFSQLQGMQGSGGSYGMAQDYNRQLLSGSPEAFEKFAAPYKTQFQEQVLPGIAERFAGVGGGLGGGALSSSGFGQALGGAATQFQSNLAGLYSQLQQAAADRAFGQYNLLSQLGLGTQAFQPAYQPGTLGFGGTAAQGLLGGLGTGLGQYMGQGFWNRFGSQAGGSTGTDLGFTPGGG